MSLSSEWERAESPLRLFFNTHFTETRVLRSDWRNSMDDKSLSWPFAIDVRPPLGSIGLAFDYRIRLALGASFSSLKGWKGLKTLGRVASSFPEAWSAATMWASKATDETIDELSDAELTRECFVLAWLEELYRAGPSVGSPLYRLSPGSGRDEVLALVDETWVIDVTAMVEGLDLVLVPWANQELIFGPSFRGSADVGGADADLIAGGTLVEIKTSKADAPDRRTFCQLAAYLLLDYDDQYSIDSVGICSGRWAMFRQWGAEEYLAKLAGQIRMDLKDMRTKFRSALQGGKVT